MIIPLYNGAGTIEPCLKSVFASDHDNFEVIVADNGSADAGARLAEAFPCRVIKLGANLGAACARNKGAQNARGSLLAFIDSDIIIQKDTLTRLQSATAPGGADAAGGIYAPEPAAGGLVTAYKNLYCHYVASVSSPSANYFSTSCGAVKRAVFEELGGFDGKFKEAGGEDIEFGYRLTAKSYKITRDTAIQVAHQKTYTLTGLLKNDFKRAKLWIWLLLEEKFLRKRSFFKNEADVSNKAALSVALVWVAVTTAALAPFSILYGQMSLASFALFFAVNLGLLRLFYRAKGAGFAVLAGLLYFMALFSASLGAVAGLAGYLAGKKL